MAEVIEAYRDYSPPSGARATVLELLATVPSGQLSGLGKVVLTNSAALTGVRRRRWSWSRGKKVKHMRGVRGLYHYGARAQPAWIELFVDQILSEAPEWALGIELLRAGYLGEVLFHEVGHHIHATQHPEHREREDVADEWRDRLMRMHARRRHRVATTLLRPLASWARRLSRALPGA